MKLVMIIKNGDDMFDDTDIIELLDFILSSFDEHVQPYIEYFFTYFCIFGGFHQLNDILDILCGLNYLFDLAK